MRGWAATVLLCVAGVAAMVPMEPTIAQTRQRAENSRLLIFTYRLTAQHADKLEIVSSENVALRQRVAIADQRWRDAERELSVEAAANTTRVAGLRKDARLREKEFSNAIKALQEEFARQSKEYESALRAAAAAGEELFGTDRGREGISLIALGDPDSSERGLALINAEAEMLKRLVSLKRASISRAQATTHLGLIGRVPSANTRRTIELFEEVIADDPCLHCDWVSLAGLYRDANQLSKSLNAALKAESFATTDSEKAAALDAQGEVLALQNSLGGALEKFSQSFRLREQLAQSNGASAAQICNSVESLNKIGNVLRDMNDSEGAIAQHEEASRRSKILMESDPGSLYFTRSFVASQFSVAGILIETGKTETATDIITTSISIINELLLKYRNDKYSYNLLANLHAKNGDILSAKGHYQKAIEQFGISIKYLSDMIDIDKEDANLKRNLAIVKDHVGLAFINQGDPESAIKYYNEAIEILEKLASGDPTNARIRRDIAVMMEHSGDVYLQSDAYAQAASTFENVLEIRDKLALADGKNVMLQRELSYAIEKSGSVYLARNNIDEATARFERSLRIRERLTEEDPANLNLKRDLAIALDKLGGLLFRKRDFSGALVYFEKSQKISEFLATDAPTIVILQRDVAISFDNVGRVLAAQGKLDAAIINFNHSLELRRKLLAGSPSDRQLQRQLMVSYWQIAEIAPPARHWTRLRQQLESMAANGPLSPGDMKLLDKARKYESAESAAVISAR
jgi:tetratricopeptide (TPR) repeat protein